MERKIGQMGPRRHEDRVGNDRPGARGGPPGPPGTGRTGSRRVDGDERPRATRVASRSGSSRRPRGDAPARVASLAPAERKCQKRSRTGGAPRASRASDRGACPRVQARTSTGEVCTSPGDLQNIVSRACERTPLRARVALPTASEGTATSHGRQFTAPARTMRACIVEHSRLPRSKSIGTRDREPARFIVTFAFNGHFQTKFLAR